MRRGGHHLPAWIHRGVFGVCTALSRFTQRLGNVDRWRVGRRRAVLPRREAPDVPLCAVDVGRERSMLRSAGVLPHTGAAMHNRKFVALARVFLLPTGSA
jgi:hypothetical protein